MRLASTGCRLGALAVAGLAVLTLSACGELPGGPGATFQDGVEAIPGPGYYVGTSTPEIASAPMRIGSFGEDGVALQQRESIEAGQRITFSGIDLPGRRGVLVNDVRCEGWIPIETDRVTDVVLHLGADGCTVTVTGFRPAEGP